LYTGGPEVQLHYFRPHLKVEESGNNNDVATLSPVKYRGTYWIGDWMDSGPVYMLLEKRLFFCLGKIRNADRSARNVVSTPAPQAVKILTVMPRKNCVFWIVTPCCLEELDKYFGSSSEMSYTQYSRI
jgi:hypothetical protein